MSWGEYPGTTWMARRRGVQSVGRVRRAGPMQVMGPSNGRGYGTRVNGLAQILCRSGRRRMDRYHRESGCRY